MEVYLIVAYKPLHSNRSSVDSAISPQRLDMLMKKVKVVMATATFTPLTLNTEEVYALTNKGGQLLSAPTSEQLDPTQDLEKLAKTGFKAAHYMHHGSVCRRLSWLT